MAAKQLLAALSVAIFVALFVAFPLVACTPLAPYRVSATDADADCSTDSTGNVPVPCRTSVLEHTRHYELLFVEFDDQGLQYPAERFGERAAYQINDALARVKELAERHEGVSLVVFVHGWKHNAAHDDTNLKAFRAMLESAALVEQSHSSDYRVVGLYVGWRGLSSTVSPMRELSFWTRKSSALHIAMGSSRELFARLRGLKCSLVRNPAAGSECEEAPGSRTRMRLVMIGHSFGGLILYNAVSGALMESLARAYDTGDRAPVARYADLIVLLNPAFEATRYTPLHRIATSRAYPKNDQPPLFVSVTTSADWATSTAFPLGRQLNTLFQHHASQEERQANRRTIGHMPLYITHTLTRASAASAGCEAWVDPSTVPQADRLARVRSNLQLEERNSAAFFRQQTPGAGLPVGWSRAFCGGAVLSHAQYDPHSLVWNVRADASIMAGHDDIANPVLGHFLRQLYHDTVAAPMQR